MRLIAPHGTALYAILACRVDSCGVFAFVAHFLLGGRIVQSRDWIQLAVFVIGLMAHAGAIMSRFTRLETKQEDHIANDEKIHTRLETGLKEQGEQIRALQIAQGGKR